MSDYESRQAYLRIFSEFSPKKQKAFLEVMAVVDLDLFSAALDLIFDDIERSLNVVDDAAIDQAAAELLDSVDLNF
jgi:hypothetical protein